MIDNKFKHKKGNMSNIKQYIKVYKELLEKCETTYEAMMVVAISEFVYMPNGCYAKIETLSEKCFMSERQGQRVVKALHERGVINLEKQQGKTYKISFKEFATNSHESATNSRESATNSHPSIKSSSIKSLNTMCINTEDSTNTARDIGNTHKDIEKVYEDIRINIADHLNEEGLIQKQSERDESSSNSKQILIQNLTIIQNSNSNTNLHPSDYSSNSSNNRPTEKENDIMPYSYSGYKKIQSEPNSQRFGATVVDVLRPVFSDQKKFVPWAWGEGLRGRVDLDELRGLRDWMIKTHAKIKIEVVSSPDELMKEIERVKSLKHEEFIKTEKKREEDLKQFKIDNMTEEEKQADRIKTEKQIEILRKQFNINF